MKTVQVRATKPLTHEGKSFVAGDLLTVLEQEALKLIEDGLAELVKPKGADPKK